MKPIFKWVGGKRSRLQYMKFPKQIREYREPFCGSAAVCMYLAPKQVWLNDVDPNVANIHAVVADEKKAKELYRRLTTEEVRPYPSTKEQSAERDAAYSFTPDRIPNVDQAFLFLRLIHWSHLGNPYKTGLHTYKVSKPRSFRAFNGRDKARLIAQAHTILAGARVTCMDFASLITDTGKGVFLFLDPPYEVGQKRKRENRHYSEYEDDIPYRLGELLKATKHKFLLTVEDCSIYRDLFSWAQIQSVETKYKARTKEDKNTVELFISNY